MDPHFKKTVTLSLPGRRLELKVAQDLFSSHAVDVGTRLLLRTLAGPEHESRRLILDLGCGYGPIGLGLKATGASRVVHMVDRDALAVEYSRENAALNRLDDVEVYGSLGYADVRVVRLRPDRLQHPRQGGRAGDRASPSGRRGLLEPDGLVAIVVIAPLQASVAAILEGSPDIEIVFRRATASYAVFHYRFRDRAAPAGWPEGQAPGLEVYERQRLSLRHKGIGLQLQTAYGLPEFDSLSFTTELVADAILRLRGPQPRTALVLHPGQGFLPSLLWAALKPDGSDSSTVTSSRCGTATRTCSSTAAPPTGSASAMRPARTAPGSGTPTLSSGCFAPRNRRSRRRQPSGS